MLKCPNHGLPKDIIITNFYVRLSRQDKDLLDASSMGSFTNEKIDAKWELLERIQRNTEDWEIDKGKESGIIYEYDMHVTFCDWENDDNATYDLENLFGTNYESDDMESSKLGDDRIASPLPISDVVIDNSFANNNKDNMFTNIVASNDNALLYYDDVITPIYSYCKGTYDIRRNYPYEIVIIMEGITPLLNTIFKYT